MKWGTIRDAAERYRLIPIVLVIGVAGCAALVAFTKLSSIAGACVTVASALFAAALGTFLRLDYDKGVTHNQARPATRRLFDQVARMQGLVEQSEVRRDALEEAAAQGLTVDPLRASDWFREIGVALRNEISATASAVEDWGDLAPEIRKQVFEQYLTREERLPKPSTEGSAE